MNKPVQQTMQDPAAMEAMLRMVRRSSAEEKASLEREVADLKAELAGAQAALDYSRRQANAQGDKSAYLEASAEMEIWRAKAESWRLEATALKGKLIEQKEAFEARQVEFIERLHLQKTDYEARMQQMSGSAHAASSAAPEHPRRAAPAPEPVTISLSIPSFDWCSRLKRWWDEL
jgi:hypothetical protein